jgi:hypothetical protein
VNGLPRPAELPQAVWINPSLEKMAPQDAPGSTIVTSDDLWVDPIRESQTLISPEALH